MGFLNSAGLARFVSKIMTALDGKLDVSQGVQNEGCYMVVDENGSLVPENVPVCVGIPDEMDRIGRVRITSANATDATFPFTLADEDYALEPSCIYAGSVHIYMSGAGYTSNLDLSEYQDTEMLVFSNTLMIGSTVFRFVWMIDTEEEEAKVVAYSGETLTRLDTMFSGSGIARIELNVRKVQAEPY
ncbi:MAG: hypothetical protein IJT77_12995 [Clostridia bacterium]|nr:hypothetical protein [Clostridia bacterium]